MTERVFCIFCALSLIAVGWLAGSLCTWTQVLRDLGALWAHAETLREARRR